MAKHFGREDRSGDGWRIAVHLDCPLPRTRRSLASPWVVAGAPAHHLQLTPSPSSTAPLCSADPCPACTPQAGHQQ